MPLVICRLFPLLATREFLGNMVWHFGHKLKCKHIKWPNHEMKVSVATQLFSHYAAPASTFLGTIKLKGFENSKNTSNFVLFNE